MIPHCLDSLPFRVPANDNNPASRRAILERWGHTAPENDSDIFSRRARSSSPRMAHADLERAALLVWRRLRENSESDGVGSNWLAAHEVPEAENDNDALIPLVENELREDNPGALLRRLGDYETEEREEVILRREEDGRFAVAERRPRVCIVGERTGAFERYPETAFRKKPRSRTKLVAPGGIRRCGIAVFAGPEHRKQGVASGTLGYLTTSGTFVPIDVDWEPVERTSAPPPASSVPDTDSILDAQQRLGHLLPVLQAGHVRILDEALRAENFERLGNALGRTGTYASKAGRKALSAACRALIDALESIDKKSAA